MKRGKRMYSEGASRGGPASSKIQKQEISLTIPRKLTSFSTTVEKTEADPDTDSRREVPAEANKDPDIAEHTILKSPKVYLHKEKEANLKQIQSQRIQTRCVHRSGYQHKKQDNCIESVNYDLTNGYGTEKAWIHENRYISLLLESLHRDEKVPDSGFVCHSGLLVEFGAIGFNKQEGGDNFKERDKGMKFAVQKVGDVFYMCELQTKETKLKYDDETKEEKEKRKKKEYAGMKFESYITTPEGDHQTSTSDESLDPNLEFNVVWQANLDKHTLTYKSEIDACFPDDLSKFIEIKATSYYNPTSFAPSWYKKLRWWLQTYLASIKDIVVGDLVQELDGQFYTKKLLTTTVDTIIDDSTNAKVKDAMLQYIINVLQFVKTRNEIVDHSAFVFVRQPGEMVFTCQKEPSAAFLPYWFVQNVFAKIAGNT